MEGGRQRAPAGSEAGTAHVTPTGSTGRPSWLARAPPHLFVRLGGGARKGDGVGHALHARVLAHRQRAVGLGVQDGGGGVRVDRWVGQHCGGARAKQSISRAAVAVCCKKQELQAPANRRLQPTHAWQTVSTTVGARTRPAACAPGSWPGCWAAAHAAGPTCAAQAAGAGGTEDKAAQLGCQHRTLPAAGSMRAGLQRRAAPCAGQPPPAPTPTAGTLDCRPHAPVARARRVEGLALLLLRQRAPPQRAALPRDVPDAIPHVGVQVEGAVVGHLCARRRLARPRPHGRSVAAVRRGGVGHALARRRRLGRQVAQHVAGGQRWQRRRGRHLHRAAEGDRNSGAGGAEALLRKAARAGWHKELCQMRRLSAAAAHRHHQRGLRIRISGGSSAGAAARRTWREQLRPPAAGKSVSGCGKRGSGRPCLANRKMVRRRCCRAGGQGG